MQLSPNIVQMTSISAASEMAYVLMHGGSFKIGTKYTMQQGQNRRDYWSMCNLLNAGFIEKEKPSDDESWGSSRIVTV
jgi:hypothetical protein